MTLTRIYGHRFTSAFSDLVDPGNVWAAVLRGVSEKQVLNGLSRLVESGHEWPPTAIEFRTLCLQEKTGTLPTLQEASRSFLSMLSRGVINLDWSLLHPVYFWAYKSIGSYQCSTMPVEYLAKAFANLWPEAQRLDSSGGFPEAPALQLPNPEKVAPTEADRLAGSEVLRALKAEYGIEAK